jgi:hypothetical protein
MLLFTIVNKTLHVVAKTFTPYPLAAHSNKKVGLVLTLACLPFLVAAQWLDVSDFFSPGRATDLLILIIALGLSFIAFSKEKQDDERVIAIRYAAYRITLSIFSISLISFASVDVFGRVPVTLDAGVLACLLLALYIAVFHWGLYSDAASFYANNSARDNFRSYRRQILLYLVPVTLLVLVGLGLVMFAL